MSLSTETDKVAHLLRRFAFGASEQEVDFYGRGGLAGAVDTLLDYESVPLALELTDEFLKNDRGQMVANPRFAQGALYMELLTTTRPLQAKMAVFWHDHFATSAQKVSNGPAMLRQWRTLSEMGTGSFYDLLVAVSKDPAMLYWLDNHLNVKGTPNENFAREVMELFTLSEGHYTEQDIREASRAFTGWTFGFRAGQRVRVTREEVPRGNSVYIFDEPNHDFGRKTVLGQSGDWNGDDVLRILCDSPRTAFYITEKIWRWFVYPEPERSVVEKHASVFRRSGLNIKSLLRSVMLDPEFYSARAARAVLKNPVDFVIPAYRQMGVGGAMSQQLRGFEATAGQRGRRALGPSIQARQSTTGMGMELLFPPDVNGWGSDVQWVTTSTMVERMRFGSLLFVSSNGNPTAYPAISLFAGDRSPEGVVRKLLSVFDAPVPESKWGPLVAAAREVSGGDVTARTANRTAAAVMRLVCASPEFQFM